MISHKVLLFLIGSNLFYNKFVYSNQDKEINKETVLITSSSNIKYIEVPTSDDPILTWMEIRKGIFPNVTKDLTPITNVSVGDPITLFIFYKDDSNLYDITVTDCWAYDDKDFPQSKQKLHLNENSSNRSSNKILTKWKKLRSRKFPSFLYANFTLFKFPDKDQIYFSCDIQLIGKVQNQIAMHTEN